MSPQVPNGAVSPRAPVVVAQKLFPHGLLGLRVLRADGDGRVRRLAHPRPRCAGPRRKVHPDLVLGDHVGYVAHRLLLARRRGTGHHRERPVRHDAQRDAVLNVEVHREGTHENRREGQTKAGLTSQARGNGKKWAQRT